jgi:ABC-2 type transport system ATP-binding protein
MVSSHLLSEIDQMATDIGIIDQGELLYQGSLQNLHEQTHGSSLEDIFLNLTGRSVSL